MPGKKTLIQLQTGSIDNVPSNRVGGTIYFATKTYGNEIIGQIVYDTPSNERVIMGTHSEVSDAVLVDPDNRNEILVSGINPSSSTRLLDSVTNRFKSSLYYSDTVSFIGGTLYAGSGLEIGSSATTGGVHSDASYLSKSLSVNAERTNIGNGVLTVNHSSNGATRNVSITRDTTISSATGSTSVSTGALKVSGGVGVGGQLTALRLAANGSNTSYNLYVNGPSLLNGNVLIGNASAGGLGLAQTNGTGVGISLYGGTGSTKPTYGLTFAKTATANFGTYGYVNGD